MAEACCIEEDQLEMLGEVFTDIVEDVIEIEEASDFWILYVDVVRTFY